MARPASLFLGIGRDTFKAWVDGDADRDKARAVYDSVAQLRVGEGWVWAAGSGGTVEAAAGIRGIDQGRPRDQGDGEALRRGRDLERQLA